MTALLLLFFTIIRSSKFLTAFSTSSDKPQLVKQDWVVRRWRYRLLGLLTTLALVVITAGCDRLESSSTWAIYRNPDYRFEFPYPQTWVPVATPANRDGQAFVAPENPEVEIRGWASQIVLNRNTYPSSPQSIPSTIENFVTAQGLAAELLVEIDAEVSAMTLNLTQDHIAYSWQGRSPNRQFSNYYSLFNYIASQFRVSLQPN